MPRARSCRCTRWRRVCAVADVHGLMKIDERVSTTDLGALLRRLAETTCASAQLPFDALVFAADCTPVTLDSNRAVAVGLVVNEL